MRGCVQQHVAVLQVVVAEAQQADVLCCQISLQGFNLQAQETPCQCVLLQVASTLKGWISQE